MVNVRLYLPHTAGGLQPVSNEFGLSCLRLPSPPVVRGRHSDSRPNSSQIRHNYVRRAVPPGDDALDFHDVASKLPAALSEDAGPEDDLHVARFVLDGYEYGALPSARMLPRHRLARYDDLVAVFESFDLGSGQYVRTKVRPDERHPNSDAS